MIQPLLNSETWLDVRTWREQYSQTLTPMQVNILSVVTPLTSLVEGKYGMKLDVHLHDQFVDNMNIMEAELLKASTEDRCLRRKVSLLCRGEVMFNAESVLPLDALSIELVTDLEAGKRPLANLLSDQGLLLSRSNLNITKIQNEGLYQGNWARRSVLNSTSGAKALVVEVFHDAMWRKLHYLVNR